MRIFLETLKIALVITILFYGLFLVLSMAQPQPENYSEIND